MNPVFRKDILSLLRLKRVAAIQILFVLALGLWVLATWPQGGVLAGGIEMPTAGGRGGDTLLLGLMLGQIVLLTLLVPAVAATALSGEREGGTLEMLYASRLSPGRIIRGKIAVAVAYPMLFLISALPFLALLAWRGDVRGDELWWAGVVLVLSAVLVAAVSLAISAYVKQSATALVSAYLAVLAVGGAVLVPAAIMLESQQGAIAGALHYARALSPVAALLSILRPDLVGGDLRGFLPLWQVFVPAAVLVVLTCFVLIAAKLRVPPGNSEGFGAATGGSGEERSLARKMLFLIDPKKKRKPLRGPNPVIGKERRTSNLRSGRWMIRIFYASLLVSLGLAVMSLYGGVEHGDLLRYVAGVIVAFQMGLIALVAPSLTSAAVSGELENGTFELLRIAPLRVGAIFWGKLLPAAAPALLPVLALTPAYAAMCFVDPSYLPRMLSVLPVVLLAVALCCLIGMAASSFFRQTARATAAAYLAAGALFVLPLLAWLAAPAPLPMHTARWIAVFSPLAMALNLLPDSEAAIRELRGVHLGLMGGLCVLLLAASRVRLAGLLRKG